jgi:glutaredoxin 3
MSIIIYTKTGCPWAIEAIDFLNQHNISFEERDIFKNPAWKEEVEQATGQNKSPTLNIDGVWVLDAGVEDIAKALNILL